MKIFYVSGYTRMVLFNKLIPKALRQNGYEVYEFDWNSFYKLNKVFNIFPREKVINKINDELLIKAKSYKPDFVFVLKGEPVKISTLIKLKRDTNAILFNWFGDDPWEFDSFSSKIAPYYNYFFTYDPYTVKKYHLIGQKNTFHLPYGYDMEVVKNLNISSRERKEYDCDIAFIGSYYPKREELLKELKSKYYLKIWGRGWENSECKDVYQGKALYGENMLKAFKSVKISLNIHRGFQEGVSESGEGLNLRVMESAACGAFQISNFQADIPNRFIPGKEIVLYKNWDEALKKIDYYLAHPEKRKSITEKGFERFKKEHTLNKRIKELFSFIN